MIATNNDPANNFLFTFDGQTGSRLSALPLYGEASTRFGTYYKPTIAPISFDDKSTAFFLPGNTLTAYMAEVRLFHFSLCFQIVKNVVFLFYDNIDANRIPFIHYIFVKNLNRQVAKSATFTTARSHKRIYPTRSPITQTHQPSSSSTLLGV